MSQSSQPLRLCMPLTKFSYANVPVGSTGPIPWTHISSTNNLFVLIEPSEVQIQRGVVEKRYKFKVLQDPNVHEDFDLSLLAHEAQRAVCEAKDSRIPEQQPSITIIVKSPCIAMRYPLQESQVHRFQIRFAKEEDYYETLRVFSIVKVPFIEAGTISRQQVVPTSNPHTSFLSNRSSNYTTQKNLELQKGSFQAQDDPLVASATGREDTRGGHSIVHAANSEVHPFTHSYSLDRRSDHRFVGNHPVFEPLRTSLTVPATGFSNTTAMPASQQTNVTYGLSDNHISTYIPRPSTAPVGLGANYSSDYPPKRDLPFQRKSNPLPALAPVVVVGESGHAAQTTSTETFSNLSVSHIAPTEPTEQVVGAKGKKRAAPKIRKTPAAKKPRTSATRKKGTTNKSQQSQTISIAEDLVQQHESHPSNEFDLVGHIDTQVLLDKAEAIQIARQTRSKTSQGKTITAPENHPQTDRELLNIHTSEEQSATKPVSHRTRSQTTHVPQEQPCDRLTTEPEAHPDDHVNEPSPAERQDNTTIQPETQTILPTQNTNPSQSTALQLLLSDPKFAQPATLIDSIANDTDFDSLPESDRHAALEAWMIQNLREESFLNLCKSLNGVWQRVFVNI